MIKILKISDKVFKKLFLNLKVQTIVKSNTTMPVLYYHNIHRTNNVTGVKNLN